MLPILPGWAGRMPSNDRSRRIGRLIPPAGDPALVGLARSCPSRSFFRSALPGIANPGPAAADSHSDVAEAPATPPPETPPATSEQQRCSARTTNCTTPIAASLRSTPRRTIRSNGLQLAEDKLRLLLDSVPDYAICMLSPHGVVTSWNAGGERLFGYAADEIVGRSLATFYLVPDCEDGAPAAHLMAAESDGRFEGEGLRRRRGGAVFDAHVVLTPVRDDRRELRGFSLVVRDITERKRLEDDLRRRAEDLAVANRAKEDFLATLSHELRTPLNAMLGWTRLLRMGKLDAAGMARALETIERNAQLQEQLISDILDVSRIVTGKLRLELRPTDLAPLVDATIDTLQPSASAKNITLQSAAAIRRRGPRRPRPAGTGHLESRRQRDQVHAGRRVDPRVAGTPGPQRGRHGERHRRRHRARPAAVRVRPFPPGRRVGDAAARRARARPLDCPAHRRAAWRARQRLQ